MGFRRTALGIMHSLRSKREPGDASVFAGEMHSPNDPNIKLKGAPHYNIQEMLAATASPEFLDEFRWYQANRVIINALCVGRAVAGVTIDELSARTNWCSDDIDDFEASEDGEINLRDLNTYASALGIQVDISFRAANDHSDSVAAVEGINRAVNGGTP
ncbi:MAG: hypothetical protein P4L67_04325 [Candidatus Pacebacteria bacterium]|nr:hypothetical protein [Candidatus Paceibacterota bacterium]